MNRIRVLLADDHGVVRKGLRYLLADEPRIDVVGEAGDGREAVRLAGELQPHVVVMDVAMPQLNGIEATALLTREQPHPAIVMLSMYSDEPYLLRALQAGASGYLLKDEAEPDLLRAVLTVAQGQSFFSPTIARSLTEEYMRRLRETDAQDSYALLTAREREVLQLLAEGKSTKEAAALLNVSPHTAETHRNNLMQKLGLHNTAEIVLYAVRKKIIAF